MTLLDRVMEHGFKKEKATSIIKAGQALVNNEPETLPMRKLAESDEVRLKEVKEWVSRGAYKLLEAIQAFDLDFKSKTVMDIGSSTGGFTDVALKHGAAKVFSIDVGTNQLDFKLRRNPSVVALEKTNIKDVTKEMIIDKIDIFVTDVSFISLYHVFDKVTSLEEDVTLMALIKPQFEAEISQVSDGGLVDPKFHQEIIDKVVGNAQKFGLQLKAIIPCSTKGKNSKNIEYLSLFERGNHE